MPKRLLPVLLLLATAVLAGCSDDGDDTAEDRSDDTTASASSTPASPSASASTSGPAGPSVSCDYATSPQPAAKDADLPPTEPTVQGQVAATMETSLGAFAVTLDADSAPCTVNSFVSLAEQNYFNDTPCHRMTTQGIYVLQCGDPTGTGTGGPGYTIPDEISGDESYPAGTLAMANTGAPDSGGSQFFIVYEETPLPPSYTVFGTVDDATVQLIQDVAAEGTDDSNGSGDGAPLTPVEITSVAIG
jgi:peptidyl-prolyl cis-trans isomerase B (cyclophilin B)